MKRRRVLDGLVGLAVASTAGCLGGGSGGSTPTGTEASGQGSGDGEPTTGGDSDGGGGGSTPTDGGDATTGDRPDSTTGGKETPTSGGGGSGRIEAVRNGQAEAARSLRSSVESYLAGDDGANSVDTAEATRRLDEAGRTLDDLGTGGTTDRLRRANEWLRSIVAAIGTFNDGYRKLLEAISRRRKDELEAATSLAEEAGKTFSTATGAFREAAREGQSLGETPYSERSEATFSTAVDVLVKMTKTARAQQSFATGYTHEVDGETWLTSAMVDFNTDNYSRAADRFADSKRFYDAAFESYATARERAPSGAESVFDPFMCRAQSLYDATIHFETAATAADQGRTDLAEREFRAGQRDREHGCFGN